MICYRFFIANFLSLGFDSSARVRRATAELAVQAAVAAITAVILLGVRLPMPTSAEIEGGRSLSEIARQPRFIAAVIAGAVSYMLMNFLMTAAPLAMHLCGHSQASANWGLQWHVIDITTIVHMNRWARFRRSRIVSNVSPTSTFKWRRKARRFHGQLQSIAAEVKRDVV